MLAIALATMMAVQSPDSMHQVIETTVLSSNENQMEIMNGIIESGSYVETVTMDGMEFNLFYNWTRDTCVAMEVDDRAMDLTLRLYVND
tara:strand:- start:24049 stop:24315 length:267 start_codon:yes stop_codon:yes gene_type:complete